MAAAAGATGVRSWLQTRHLTWLTPRRMKAATAVLFTVALLVSSVGLSGSGAAKRGGAAQHAPAHTR